MAGPFGSGPALTKMAAQAATVFDLQLVGKIPLWILSPEPPMLGASKCESSMKARYARLFADANGNPCFEDLSVELISGFAVPPAEPLHTAPFFAPDGPTFWIVSPPSWDGGEPHPAPRRMIFITVRGEYEVFTKEGLARKFPVGSVLVVEDTSGHGHAHYERRGMHLIRRRIAIRLRCVMSNLPRG